LAHDGAANHLWIQRRDGIVAEEKAMQRGVAFNRASVTWTQNNKPKPIACEPTDTNSQTTFLSAAEWALIA
jgi:hypothetical protein